MRHWLDKAIRGLCRLVMSIFFREIEVVGTERVPPDTPLLFVGNHTNSLVDPVLLAGFLPAMPRLLAKSTLWAHPLLAPLLVLGGAIPVFRRQDASFDTESDQHMSRNEGMFARCHDVLAAGGAIALFPEGVAHNEPRLMPLKTGVARIVLEAETKHPGLGVRIVPVGLIFEARARFRSRALVKIGEPIDPSVELAQYRDDPREAVSRLTARVAERLSAVTPNYASWEDAQLANRAAEIVANDPLRGHHAELPLSKHAALSQALADGYQRLLEREPVRVAAVYEQVKSYDRLLRVFRLRTRHLISPYPTATAVGFALRTLGLLLIRLPLTAIGLALNYLPYWLVGTLATRATRDDELLATYKVFGGFFLFPLAWLAEAGLAWWALGLRAAWVMLLVAPASGWVALRSYDRRRLFLTEARAFFLLRNEQRIAADLERRRESIVEEIEQLAKRL